jgi:hypothetical protein
MGNGGKMTKGLTKAERHELRIYIRGCRFVTALELENVPKWFFRVVRAEITKRRWVRERALEMWMNPRVRT